MIVTAARGKAFQEPFTFKNDKGQTLSVPNGKYKLTLERGTFVKEFSPLPVWENSIVWRMTADETAALEYDTLYFVLFYNGQEVSRGVMRVT